MDHMKMAVIVAVYFWILSSLAINPHRSSLVKRSAKSNPQSGNDGPKRAPLGPNPDLLAADKEFVPVKERKIPLPALVLLIAIPLIIIPCACGVHYYHKKHAGEPFFSISKGKSQEESSDYDDTAASSSEYSKQKR
ncbi:hypothetical protein ACOME3_005865 [Neoechinorhynchus agilis]